MGKLKLWEYVISEDPEAEYNKSLVFMMWEFKGHSTCGEIVGKYIVRFNMKTQKFKMVKLGPEFHVRSQLSGYVDDVCYLYDWKKSVLYGLKLN